MELALVTNKESIVYALMFLADRLNVVLAMCYKSLSKSKIMMVLLGLGR